MQGFPKAALPTLLWLVCQAGFAYDVPVKNVGQRPLAGLVFIDNAGNSGSLDLPLDGQEHRLSMGEEMPPAMLAMTLGYCTQEHAKQSCALPGYLNLSRVEWQAGCVLTVALQAIPVGSQVQPRKADAVIAGMTCPQVSPNPGRGR